MRIFTPEDFPGVVVAQVPKREIRKLDFAICEQPTETLSRFYARQNTKPDLLINAGLFNMNDGTTLFDFRDEYQTTHSDPNVDYGMGIIDAAVLKFGRMTERTDWRDFVTAFPPLIIKGKPVSTDLASGLDYPARRTILAYDTDSVFLICVDTAKLTFYQCKKLCLSLGVDYAINLDGGGSTKMLVSGKCVTTTAANRPVDSVFAVYLKEVPKDETQLIYRVQTGAFSKPGNANRLRDEIRHLDDPIHAGYSSAYVRLIDDLYKVQVGAFTHRENAETVMADLKKKGYSSFITTQ